MPPFGVRSLRMVLPIATRAEAHRLTERNGLPAALSRLLVAYTMVF